MGKFWRGVCVLAAMWGFFLGLAVAEVESTFRPYVTSVSDARGLMQIKPSTAEWIAGKVGIPWQGKESLYDPRVNAEIGCAYLAYLIERFGVVGGVKAYNVGPGAYSRKEAVAAADRYANKVFNALAAS